MDNTSIFLQRIEKLERQVRVMKFAGIGLLLGCVALIVFCGATSNMSSPTKSIEAQEFKVMDSSGKCRGMLSEYGLRLFDANEKIYCLIGNQGGAPNLTIYNDNGSPRAYVGGIVKGAPELGLCDGKGNPRVFLYVSEKGESCIAFLNENGDIVKEMK